MEAGVRGGAQREGGGGAGRDAQFHRQSVQANEVGFTCEYIFK